MDVTTSLPRRSLAVQVVATPLGVQVPVVPLGLIVPLPGVADDHYGMMTIHRGMEVIHHGVEVEGGVEAIPPPLVVLPPVSPSLSRSLILNLLLILGAWLHMLQSSPTPIPPKNLPRRSLAVQATLVVVTLGVLVAGVMMDTLGMVVIGGPMDMMALGVMMVIMEKLGRLLGLRIVHTWILPLWKVVIMEVGLLLRLLLLFWLLSVQLALRRRRYVKNCLVEHATTSILHVEDVPSSFSRHLTTNLFYYHTSPLLLQRYNKGGFRFQRGSEKPAVDASDVSVATADMMDNEPVVTDVYKESPSSYVEMSDMRYDGSIPPPPPQPQQSSRFGKFRAMIKK